MSVIRHGHWTPAERRRICRELAECREAIHMDGAGLAVILEKADAVPASQLQGAVDDLRVALAWALTQIEGTDEYEGEAAEKYTGACRLAWPDDPDQWGR